MQFSHIFYMPQRYILQLQLCVHVHIYKYIYIYYVHVYISINIYIFVYIDIHICAHIHITYPRHARPHTFATIRSCAPAVPHTGVRVPVVHRPRGSHRVTFYCGSFAQIWSAAVGQGAFRGGAGLSPEVGHLRTAVRALDGS